MCHPLAQQFSFGTVEWKEVEKVINLMPTGKAPGNDKIPVRVLKNCLSSILPTLTAIVNDPFISGTFPNIWKIAEVTPIVKQGDYEKPNKNCPISLLPYCQRYVSELH